MPIKFKHPEGKIVKSFFENKIDIFAHVLMIGVPKPVLETDCKIIYVKLTLKDE